MGYSPTLSTKGFNICSNSVIDFPPQISRVSLDLEDVELIKFWNESGKVCFNGNSFKIFSVLTFLGIVPAQNPALFLSDFQDVLKPRVVKAD